MDPTLLHQSPARIMYAGEYSAQVDHPAHWHETREVIYQRSGNIKTRQGSEMISMHPGMVLVHPPRVEHADYASTPYSIFYIWIDVAGAPEWPRLHHDDSQRSIGRICEAIWREWSGQSVDRETMLELLAMELNILLQRTSEYQRRNPSDTLVADVRRILDERFREPPDGRALANEIGVSRTHLYREFAVQTGLTPGDYLAQVRLRHALSLIHGSTIPLEAVAELCGYHSASHLTRHVKSLTGKSPGRLRKEYPTPRPVEPISASTGDPSVVP